MPDAIMPINWAFFALWQKEPEDGDALFEQRVTIEPPLGNEGEFLATFQMDKESHRVAQSVVGLPVGIAGIHIIRLYLRRKDKDDWSLVTSYPLTIQHPKRS